MYINNVGTVALALARDGQIEVDPKVIGAWQAKQVATISIWNCLGRVLGGTSFFDLGQAVIVSDFQVFRRIFADHALGFAEYVQYQLCLDVR